MFSYINFTPNPPENVELLFLLFLLQEPSFELTFALYFYKLVCDEKAFFFCFLFFRKDATLRELMDLVKEVNPDARRKGTCFDFGIVSPNFTRGTYNLKEIGTTYAGQKGKDDSISLQSRKFQIGDFLDIAISTPRKDRQD